MKNSSKLIISELFLIRVGHNKLFKGKIIKETLKDGKVYLHGNTVAYEGKIWGTGNSEKEIMSNLDKICEMKLNMELHNDIGQYVHLIFPILDNDAMEDKIFLN